MPKDHSLDVDGDHPVLGRREIVTAGLTAGVGAMATTVSLEAGGGRNR
jgi:hypothetical protein